MDDLRNNCVSRARFDSDVAGLCSPLFTVDFRHHADLGRCLKCAFQRSVSEGHAMKSVFALLAAGLLALSAAPGSANDLHVWLIGGGNHLANSQGQIEENVRWLEDMFAHRGLKTRSYYTHGQGAEGDHDVVYFALPEARDPILEPILRVYGQGLQYALDTRTNSLRNIVGSTEKSVLKDRDRKSVV